MTDIILSMSTYRPGTQLDLNKYPDVIYQVTPSPTEAPEDRIQNPIANVQRILAKEETEAIQFATVGVNKIVITEDLKREDELLHEQTRMKRQTRQTRQRTFEPIELRKNNGPLIIHDKRWYFRLVQAKHGEYRRARALMDDYNLNEIANHMVVCFTPDYIPGSNRPFKNKDGNPIRIYAFFDSYLEFYEYMQKFNSIERAFYEIIFGELPQKPHFDIDISINDLNSIYPGEDIDTVAETLREAVMMGCITVLSENLVMLDMQRDILLYSSHGEDKRSYHLILNNKCHDGNKEAKAFYDAVMGKIRIITQGKYLEFVDKSVYSPRQQFRMVGCQKQGSNRPKVFYEQFSYQGERYTHIYNEDVTDFIMKKLTIIYESMISFTSGCVFLPSLIHYKPVNHNYLGEMPDLDGNIVEHCMAMLREKMASCSFTITDRFRHDVIIRPTCPFSVKEVRGHLILLKRNSPSYCPICRRSTPHEHENPYMFIAGGKVYWDCRRSPDDAGKFFVGYLAMSIDELQTGMTLPGTVTDEEDNIDEGGEFMFGDYNIGAPTLPPLKKIENKQGEGRRSPPSIQNSPSQIIPISQKTLSPTPSPTVIIPMVNIPPEQRQQNVQSLTLKIAKDLAQNKYIRSQPEDLTGVRSLSTVLNQISWIPGIK